MKFNLDTMVRPHLLGAKSYKSLRNSYLDQKMDFLDANENPFGEFNRYPDSEHLQLKNKLAEINEVQATQLFLGNGSDELIDLAMRVFCEPTKDAIMMMNPSFVMYEMSAKLNNLKVEKLQLDEDFQIDRNKFEEEISKTKAKILFLCSPNNPTGNSINDLEFYIQNFDGVVIVDEAYIEFSKQKSAVDLLSKYPNLIVLKTLSKAYGMAGLRIGYGISSPEIADLFNQFKPPYNIGSESQKLALEQLKNTEQLKQNISIVLENRERLKIDLQEIETVLKIYPSDANFFLVEFKDAEIIYEKLLNANILTSLRHPALQNCLRITVGTAEENSKLLKILSQI
ncbi:histidinol-phosphate transaminase [Frigoriflavimonas asaccharolytica]|uniref:Histidinol-phosphate aminotransferase n=1 Tax=Frigoriflavimonas asaccharolytica TaxID=2735899 RepID=A0A8J8G680_9FLAO|nr:histidinol-phosphate transaminase [Frigoriflavimonas asaccharolytica]NRS91475.1 histidinol-phosphate aminotransferase [Frigoriflavimonas asaccharolytica]